MICLPSAARAALATLLLPPSLQLGDDRQHVVQTLVLNDFGSMHRSQRIEGPVGQGKALGLLSIELKREVPEAMKPRKITIGSELTSAPLQIEAERQVA
jgi:hypothetical protein